MAKKQTIPDPEPELPAMSPEQVSLLMQLEHVHRQIDLLNTQARQLAAALFPKAKRKSVPFDRKAWRANIDLMRGKG